MSEPIPIEDARLLAQKLIELNNDGYDWNEDTITDLIQTHTRLARIDAERQGMAWVHATVLELTGDPKLIDKLNTKVQERLDHLKSKEGEQLVGCSECGVFAKNEAELMEHKVMRHPKWSKL